MQNIRMVNHRICNLIESFFKIFCSLKKKSFEEPLVSSSESVPSYESTAIIPLYESTAIISLYESNMVTLSYRNNAVTTKKYRVLSETSMKKSHNLTIIQTIMQSNKKLNAFDILD